MQSRMGSFAESLLNILIGYSVALASQVIIFKWYGVHLGMKDQAMIGIWFTIVSIVRSYIVRRFFNRLTIRKMQNAASN